MKGSIYALVIGINDYPPPVDKLAGAESDAKKISDFISENYKEYSPKIKILLNKDATYQSVLSGFREHLNKAGQNDIIWFHYSGHGSRQPAAPELEKFNSGKKDETLVLYDSRPNGKDLADKELAVLIHEVSKNGAHTVISLDCCHSGSGTRSVDTDAGVGKFRTRLSDDRTDARSLDSYLEGYFVKNGLEVPKSDHVLLAACNRFQTSKETWSGSGLFTENLLKTLTEIGKEISYADLFVKLRQGVVGFKWDQDPQIEPSGNFNINTRFLDGTPMPLHKKYALSLSDEQWKMEAGEILGFNTDTNSKIWIYKDGFDTPFCSAVIIETDAQQAFIKAEQTLSKDNTYWAVAGKISSVPVDVSVKAEAETLDLIRSQFAGKYSFNLLTEVEDHHPSDFTIKESIDKLELWHNVKNILIGKAMGKNAPAISAIFKPIEHICSFMRIRDLQNPASVITSSACTMTMDITDPQGKVTSLSPGSLTLKNTGGKYFYKVMIKNNFTQPLHFALFYLTENFGVMAIKNEPLEKSESPTLFFGGTENDYFELPAGVHFSTDILFLIISTERTDEFKLEMESLELGAELPVERVIPGLNRTTKVKGEWYTSKFVVTITE